MGKNKDLFTRLYKQVDHLGDGPAGGLREDLLSPMRPGVPTAIYDRLHISLYTYLDDALPDHIVEARRDIHGY